MIALAAEAHTIRVAQWSCSRESWDGSWSPPRASSLVFFLQGDEGQTPDSNLAKHLSWFPESSFTPRFPGLTSKNAGNLVGENELQVLRHLPTIQKSEAWDHPGVPAEGTELGGLVLCSFSFGNCFGLA